VISAVAQHSGQATSISTVLAFLRGVGDGHRGSMTGTVVRSLIWKEAGWAVQIQLIERLLSEAEDLLQMALERAWPGLHRVT
jgi:hypothetical protein